MAYEYTYTQQTGEHEQYEAKGKGESFLPCSPPFFP